MTWEILQRLINHFIIIVNEGEQAMVVRKLASSLVAVFRNQASSWRRALWQLAASLAHGEYVPERESQTVEFLSGVLPALTTQKATALVFFSVALAEETLRLEFEPQELVGQAIERAVENIQDAFLLVKYIMQQVSYNAAEHGEDPTQITLVNEAMSSWKVKSSPSIYLYLVDQRLLILLFPFRPGSAYMGIIAIRVMIKLTVLPFSVARASWSH